MRAIPPLERSPVDVSLATVALVAAGAVGVVVAVVVSCRRRGCRCGIIRRHWIRIRAAPLLLRDCILFCKLCGC